MGTSLTSEQRKRLGVMLRNESDVAYKRRVRHVIDYLALRCGHTVLDCGTGMGFYIKVIRALYPMCHIHGIDRDVKVLRYAGDHAVGRHVTLACGDVENLPYASEGFDRVIMSEVLEHLANDRRGLQEVHRVMKPGAVLALTVPSANYPYWYDPISRIAEDAFHRPIRHGPFAGIWANHERLYEREQLVELVQGAGFVVDKVERLTHYSFPGTQTIVYTFGKGLIEKELLPSFVGKYTHRFRGEDNSGSLLNPINWILAIFNWIDRWNEDPELIEQKSSFVNIALRARKR